MISCINAWKCGKSVTRITSTSILSDTATSVLAVLSSLVMSTHGGTIPETNEIVTHIFSCHNFFSLSSVQIIIIPACCLLCVL